jgi:hypothetical protein
VGLTFVDAGEDQFLVAACAQSPAIVYTWNAASKQFAQGQTISFPNAPGGVCGETYSWAAIETTDQILIATSCFLSRTIEVFEYSSSSGAFAPFQSIANVDAYALNTALEAAVIAGVPTLAFASFSLVNMLSFNATSQQLQDAGTVPVAQATGIALFENEAGAYVVVSTAAFGTSVFQWFNESTDAQLTQFIPSGPSSAVSAYTLNATLDYYLAIGTISDTPGSFTYAWNATSLQFDLAQNLSLAATVSSFSAFSLSDTFVLAAAEFADLAGNVTAGSQLLQWSA